MTINLLLAAIGCFVLYLTVVATFHILRSDSFDTWQKVVIVTFVWLIPLIGAIFIISLLASDRPLGARRKRFALFDYLLLSAVVDEFDVSNHDNSTCNDFGSVDCGGDDA